jgi:hypothetical protein
MFLAQRLAAPELHISENESQRLASAINEVASHYPGIDLDPVVKAWLGLAFTAGSIYAPRVMAFRQRLSDARRAPPVNEAAHAFN